MKTKRKICILQLLEGFNLGGAERKLLELVRCMDKDRFKTVVCSLGLQVTRKSIRDEFEQLRDKGVEVIEIPRKHRLDVSLIYKLVKLVKRYKIDIIMTNLFYADIMGALVGKLTRVKAVFTWEASPNSEWLIPRRLISYRLLIRWCDKIISVSQDTANFLVNKRGVNPDKITVIPYGVDLDKYYLGNGHTVRRKLGLNDKNKVIGVVSRLHPQKGHAVLIEASSDIIKKYPQTKFLIIGDGSYRSTLESLVKRKKLKEHYIFLGSRDDIPELLQAIDIFTLPSYSEGLPNVVLEAMATQKPVVATSVGGIKEAVVNKETGLLVPPQDPVSLGEALGELLENPEEALEFGKKSRKRAEEYFSLKSQVESFENLFEHYYKKV